MRPRVWAPHVSQVTLVAENVRYPMQREDSSSWWQTNLDLSPGQRYGFSLDGGPARPDPRTLSQPDGVHGLSRVVDPAVFSRPQHWVGKSLRGAVSYELHVGTFTSAGTLDAAIDKLDYLVELGIEAVELMPLAAFAGTRGWGYDGVAPWSVHESYGGPEALVRFVDAAHAKGLGVILDVVHNHLGPEGNYLAEFGPYFTQRHSTPWGDAVNLDDLGCEEVRAFLLGSARYFLLDVGLDGLRLDAVHALRDDSAQHFLAELSQYVALWSKESGRPLTLIAESDLNQATMVSPVGSSPEARGMAAQWADDIHHSLHSFFSGEQQGYYADFNSAEALVKALTRVFVHDGCWSSFRNCDWGAPVDTTSAAYDGHSFVAFLQNHDQVGNRAIGDRFAQHAGAVAQATAAALYLLSPFTPMIFMGEEWAASTPFPFFSDLGPELGPSVTAGRAREFAAMGWRQSTPDPQAESTFASAVLRWEEQSLTPHAQMLAWYRQLLSLRRRYPQLANPDLAQASARVLDPDTIEVSRGEITITARRGSGVSIAHGGEQIATFSAATLS